MFSSFPTSPEVRLDSFNSGHEDFKAENMGSLSGSSQFRRKMFLKFMFVLDILHTFVTFIQYTNDIRSRSAKHPGYDISSLHTS